MRALYRQSSVERLQPLLPLLKGGSVLELFAGEGLLATLHPGPYRGVERSDTLVRRARKKGRTVEQGDVRTVDLPSTDLVVMVDGLYQLLPPGNPEDACEKLLRRARTAARKGVLVVEPVANLELPGWLGGLAAHLVDAGDGPIPGRFSEAALEEFAKRHRARWTERWGRDLCLFLPPSSDYMDDDVPP
jgi:hypothetical protein